VEGRKPYVEDQEKTYEDPLKKEGKLPEKI